MTTLPELLEQRPKMRYIFTGGKGGVGKTVAAAGLAYHYASQGESVLVASLNPVHSLSSLFGQSLSGGKVIEVDGAKNVHAVEVETTEVVERYRNSIRGRVKEFLKWADIPLDAKPFIEIAATASYSWAFSRASVIFPTHLLRISAMAIMRTPWPNGGMSKTYKSWPLVDTRSAIASYVADSYIAGSADVESMYSSISAGSSDSPYIVRIFCLTSPW